MVTRTAISCCSVLSSSRLVDRDHERGVEKLEFDILERLRAVAPRARKHPPLLHVRNWFIIDICGLTLNVQALSVVQLHCFFLTTIKVAQSL